MDSRLRNLKVIYDGHDKMAKIDFIRDHHVEGKRIGMKLAKARIAFSLAVFILFILLFLGGEKLSEFLSPLLLPFQLIPALIRIFTKPGAIFIFGLISVFICTLIFGRVYCSFVCPLGFLQDIFIALSRKFGWRKKHSYQIQSIR